MRPGWMTDDDEAILGFLHQTELYFTMKGLAFNLPNIGYYQVGNRVPVLNDKGFVERPAEAPDGVTNRGVYRISELGSRFVTGDITLQELRERTEKR